MSSITGTDESKHESTKIKESPNDSLRSDEFAEACINMSEHRQKLFDEYMKLIAASILSEMRYCRSVTIDELLAPIREELSYLQNKMDNQYFDEESAHSATYE